MQSRMIWIVIGVVLGGVFLFLSMRSIDIAASLHVAVDANPFYVFVAVLSSCAFMLVKSWRWRLLVSPVCRLSVEDLLPAVYTGTAVNLIVSHAGEFARSIIVANRFPVPAGTLLGTIAIERLFDTVTVLLFLALLAAETQHLAPIIVSASYIAIGLVLAAVVAVVVGLLWTEGSLRLVDRMVFFLPPRWRERIVKNLRSAVAGVATIRQAHILPGVILLSLLQWSCILMAIYASVRSLGVEPNALAAIAVLILLVVGLSLPAAPVHLGTTQFGFMVGLGAFQINAHAAFAASIIYTLFVLLPMLVLGLITLSHSGLKWSAVSASRPPAGPAPATIRVTD